MNRLRLCLRNLTYHWRGNSAVALGVAVGTAVLTGALLVGDSLRGSLRELTLRRLGWVDQAMVTPDFFRQEVADELRSAGAAERVAPALLLQGTAARAPASEAAPPGPTARHVSILGVDEAFGIDESWWGTEDNEVFLLRTPMPGTVTLNRALAEALGVDAGDRVALRLQKPSAVPRESLLGRKEAGEVVDDWTLPVGRVLGEADAADHFSLRPGLEAPRNAYVRLKDLQERLGKPGRVNAVLVGAARPELSELTRERLTLDDWGLVLRDPPERVEALFAKLDRNRDGRLAPSEYRGRVAESFVQAVGLNPERELTRKAVEDFYRRERNYLSLESPRLLLPEPAGDAALAAAKETGLRAAPTLVYLANGISDGKATIPYSLVAALDPAEKPPLGPFLPPGVDHLADDQIVLADWPESPLHAKPGDRITLTYFAPEHHGGVKELTAEFRLAGVVPMTGPAADPDLTPEFPGITDKLSIDQWNPPFPFDNKRVKPADERYWRAYRTAPKAYVTLSAGQRLWGSRFGQLTSVRLAAPEGRDLASAAGEFRGSLLKHLNPEQGGFVFDPVKQEALDASAGGTDFSQLFLGFSFFLVAAALLLVGLMFRLNIDRRAGEIGLLVAAGYRRSAVRWLLLGEGAVLALLGVVAGTGLAVAYSAALVQLLAAVWPGGTLQSFLRPHITLQSLVIGAGASLLVSLLTIAWSVRVLGRVAPAALLAGQTTTEREPGARPRPRWSRRIAVASAVLGLVLVAAGTRMPDPESRAGTFFSGGALLLAACLAGAWAWMRADERRNVEGHGWRGVARLGVRNAARHPARSLLTAGLLAAAAFVLVAVEAFRRRADAGADEAASPTGGYALLAESDLPVFLDLNSDKGRDEIGDLLEQRYRDRPGVEASEVKQRVADAKELLRQTRVAAFRVRAGDDASCLNLYQPKKPRVLGVPAAVIDRGGFAFAGTDAKDGEQRAKPWTMLDRDDGGPVPAFGEAESVQWILHRGLGDAFDAGAPRPLRIDGLLQDSVFQSGLLVSEANFLRLWPGQEGYSFFLLAPPPGREQEVKRVLETALADRGFEVTPSARRLEGYFAVVNTYLTTFQALGGLGLVLGSLGLGVVLLRAVWERRAELALFRALGYRRRALGWLVLAENGFLLLVGLGAGTLSALVAVAPHLAGGAAGVPWGELAVLLAGALAVGLLAGAAATAATLRAPLVPALRRE
jgi:ABC-type lipoprotein release transport system permease subunit